MVSPAPRKYCSPSADLPHGHGPLPSLRQPPRELRSGGQHRFAQAECFPFKDMWLIPINSIRSLRLAKRGLWDILRDLQELSQMKANLEGAGTPDTRPGGLLGPVSQLRTTTGGCREELSDLLRAGGRQCSPGVTNSFSPGAMSASLLPSKGRM